MKVVILKGVTIPFRGDGRKFGYPTANIRAETQLAEGVYFGYADLGEYIARPALIFVGVPLTIEDQEQRVEAHLLDIPDEDYYGQSLTVRIHHFHRPNQRFESVEKLLTAMRLDAAEARRWFVKNPIAGSSRGGDT